MNWFLKEWSKFGWKKAGLLCLCAGALGIVFYLYLHYSTVGSFPLLLTNFKRYLLAVGSTITLGFMVIFMDSLLNKLVEWRKFFLLRFLIGFVANISVAVLLMFLMGRYVLNANQEELLKLCILYAITVFIYEIFYGWFYSYRYYSVTQVEELRAERHQLELQFESLKSQISPHYLFNCLNTISSLLYKDSRLAEEFIRRMADTFLYVVSNQKQKLVSLSEEVDFVKAYCFLLQVRFEQNLKLEINLPANVMSSKIPPLALQMLVENAIKHNRISKDSTLMIYIAAPDNTHITVTNNKTKPLQSVVSFKVGLTNIKERYKFFTDKELIVQDNEKFSVQLPVLKAPNVKINE
jgi:two-component system, LytTR family, sensor kinase